MSLRLKVVGGTPDHSDSLCFRCAHAHIYQGHAVSDLNLRCLVDYDNSFSIHSKIVECNKFYAKRDKTESELNKMGWVLEIRRGRTVGFFPPEEHKARLDSGEAEKTDHDDE